MDNKPNVLVLTPVKDSADDLAAYFTALDALTYPKEHLALGFLESDSRDGTYELLDRRMESLRGKYRRANLWKRDFGYHVPSGVSKWNQRIQVERRTALARSRNHLLLRALDDEDWVLWLDVDVIEYPAGILETLLATGRDIVQPNCVLEYGGPSFDLNAWRDHGTKHLHDLRGADELVPLDAVGGTMLLVRADVHRDGVIFPPFPYGLANPRARSSRQNTWAGELETEGLGIMALDAGVQCWGMPNLEIRHVQRRPPIQLSGKRPRVNRAPLARLPAPAPGPARPSDDVRHRELLEARLHALGTAAPPDRLRGRGIVLCAGGDTYFPCAWVCISMLRRHGCTLPIELWYRGSSEMSPAALAAMEHLGVTCVDAYPVARRERFARLDSWEIKPFAIVHSRFEEVLYLDADNVPVRDPEILFDSPPYREHGALFWPDHSAVSGGTDWLAREAWDVCGVSPRSEPELESGQLLIDKRRCWAPLLLALHLNEHSDYYYRFFYGDKDTFRVAWHRLGRTYALVPHPAVRIPGSMQQHDPGGSLLFQHRMHDKWSLSEGNRYLAGFRYEALCRQALADLRSHWRKPMRALPADFSAVESETFRRLVEQRTFTLSTERAQPRRIELLGDFRVGGAMPRGTTWMVEEDKDGEAVVAICQPSERCFFRRSADDRWRGRWRSFERALAELQPTT